VIPPQITEIENPEAFQVGIMNLPVTTSYQWLSSKLPKKQTYKQTARNTRTQATVTNSCVNSSVGGLEEIT